MAAVRQHGLALEFVREQTPELCLEAVMQNGSALKLVKEQTPEVCLAAVQQDGLALRFVKEQTPELCMAAVRQNKNALRFVSEQHAKHIPLTPPMDAEAAKLHIPSMIGGVEVTAEQRLALREGKPVVLSGVQDKAGKVHDTAYVKLDQKEGLQMFTPSAQQQEKSVRQAERQPAGKKAGLRRLFKL
jgi:hypothetical protein